MALFQLDPPSIAARVRAAGIPARPPTLTASVVRGAFGFTVVSVAGFAPWPILDRCFPWVGEAGLYVICTAVFIGLSGLLLHRLILGPGSLPRFYKLFTLAFMAHAICWVVFWMWLRSDRGIVGGLLGGAVAMGALLAWAFDAWRAVARIIAALFILNMLGFQAGSWIAGKIVIEHRLMAMLTWSVCYGLGLGAGLGCAFHFCQDVARAAIWGPSRNG